jgi:hypothetical protein
MSDERLPDEDLAPVHPALGCMVYTAATVEITGVLLAADEGEAAKLKGKTIQGLKDLTLKYATSRAGCVCWIRSVEGAFSQVGALWWTFRFNV